MTAQKYCFYLLSLLILPIYATARGGRHGGLHATDDWHPITNVHDESVRLIGDYAVFEYNLNSSSNLVFGMVVSGESRFSDGTYYRLVLATKKGTNTRNYKAIVFDQPWSHTRKLTNFDPT